ncbi:MAG TPA: VOC family protein [Rhizobiaceae bacterium]|nr:VOC family protein [Rhizobiaceae bacterium]
MFSHIVVGSNDIEASKRFYDALFQAAGSAEGNVDAKGRIVYSKDGFRFLVTKPINGESATFANGGTIGFLLKDPAMVEAWHEAGVANGGTTAENPPGIRDMGHRKVYLAYLRDPAGNKLCASCPSAS